MPELIARFDSPAAFAADLDKFMLLSRNDSEIFTSNFFPNPWYWSGNEPDIQAPALFNYVGRPDLTQKHVRWVLQNKYTNLPDGVSGNDDFGTMSAWYVWWAMGLYPISCAGEYALGSPVFDTLLIHRSAAAGGDLSIITYDNGPANVYVTKIALDGVAYDEWFISTALLRSTQKIEFWMAATPPDFATHPAPYHL